MKKLLVIPALIGLLGFTAFAAEPSAEHLAFVDQITNAVDAAEVMGIYNTSTNSTNPEFPLGWVISQLYEFEAWADMVTVADGRGRFDVAKFRGLWMQGNEAGALAFLEPILAAEPHVDKLLNYFQITELWRTMTAEQAGWILEVLSDGNTNAGTQRSRFAKWFTMKGRQYYTADQLRSIYNDLEYKYKPVFTKTADVTRWAIYVTSYAE